MAQPGFDIITDMAMLTDVIMALQNSWDCQSSFGGAQWPPNNPARGQCLVSSLVIQDYFGGELVRVHAVGDDIDENHYYNRLPDGTIIDTTGMQYLTPVTFTPNPIQYQAKGYLSARMLRLADNETRQRYEYLLHKVNHYIKEMNHGDI